MARSMMYIKLLVELGLDLLLGLIGAVEMDIMARKWGQGVTKGITTSWTPMRIGKLSPVIAIASRASIPLWCRIWIVGVGIGCGGADIWTELGLVWTKFGHILIILTILIIILTILTIIWTKSGQLLTRIS